MGCATTVWADGLLRVKENQIKTAAHAGLGASADRRNTVCAMPVLQASFQTLTQLRALSAQLASILMGVQSAVQDAPLGSTKRAQELQCAMIVLQAGRHQPRARWYVRSVLPASLQLATGRGGITWASSNGWDSTL